jgi:hypothetical protein
MLFEQEFTAVVESQNDAATAMLAKMANLRLVRIESRFTGCNFQ